MIYGIISIAALVFSIFWPLKLKYKKAGERWVLTSVLLVMFSLIVGSASWFGHDYDQRAELEKRVVWTGDCAIGNLRAENADDWGRLPLQCGGHSLTLDPGHSVGIINALIGRKATTAHCVISALETAQCDPK